MWSLSVALVMFKIIRGFRNLKKKLRGLIQYEDSETLKKTPWSESSGVLYRPSESGERESLRPQYADECNWQALSLESVWRVTKASHSPQTRHLLVVGTFIVKSSLWEYAVNQVSPTHQRTERDPLPGHSTVCRIGPIIRNRPERNTT
jgi:hypothetical protein